MKCILYVLDLLYPGNVIQITRNQAKYFLLSSVVVYSLALIVTLALHSWFGNHPLLNNLNTYQLLSPLPVAMCVGASASLKFVFDLLSPRTCIPLVAISAAFTAVSYVFYSLQFSSNPYIYLVPSGRTYVLASMRFTIFCICLTILVEALISLLLRNRKVRFKSVTTD